MAYLFLERVAEIDNGLFLHQALREACLALLAPGCARRLNLLETGDGRAASGLCCYALASSHSALLTMHFDFAVVFSFAVPSATVVVCNLLKVVLLLKVTTGRSAALADGKRDG